MGSTSWVLVAGVLAGCIESKLVPCGDLDCPVGSACTLSGECVDRGRLESCEALAEGDTCLFAGMTGTCQGGACNAQVCGDGRIDPPEECEGTDLGGASCLNFGFYQPAGLACRDDCRVDTSACVGSCGDGVKNGPELCDTVPGVELFTCYEVGFDFGSVTCSPELCAPLYDECATIGWTRHDHIGDYPQEFYAPSRGDAYLVTASAEISHVNGTSSVVVSVPVECGPNALWVAPTGEVVTAAGSTMCRYDGTAWTSMLAPTTETSINDLWGSSTTDLYAAGAELSHYDGTTWSTVATGAPAGSTFGFVYGRPGGTVVAIANGGLAWLEGGAWIYEVPVPGGLTSVWVSPNGTIYASGAGGIFRRRAGTWTRLADQPPGGSVDLWGVSDDSVFAVTNFDFHWYLDDDRWISIDGPGFLSRYAGSPSTLLAIEIYAHFYESTGDVWTPPGGNGQRISAIWGYSLSNVVAVGDSQSLHFDGATWSAKPFAGQIASLWSADPSLLIGVGSDGTIDEFDGTVWQTRGVATTVTFNAVWGESAARVFAVGGESTSRSIYSREPTGWRRVVNEPGTNPFTAIWGSLARGTYVIAPNTSLMRHLPPGAAPHQWVEVGLPDTDPIGIWGDANQLIVSFRNRRVYSFANGTWTQQATRLLAPAQQLIGGSGNIVGNSSRGPVHYDGVNWDRIRPPSTLATAVTSVFSGNGLIALGSSDGVVIMVRPR